MKLPIHKAWVIATVVVLIGVSFLFNTNFLQTFTQRRAIRQAQLERTALVLKSEAIELKLSSLEKNPNAYEQLVRSELGYLRPGEKEVRFVKNVN